MKHLFNKPKTYDKLYLRILQIGQSKLGEGLSYNDLTDILEKDGYDFSNDCIELAVKHWFYESFFHVGGDDNPYLCFTDLENHKDCGFVLKGEHCLVLLEHNTSNRNINIAWIAIVLTFIGLGFTAYQTKLYLDELQTKQQEKQPNTQEYPNPPTYYLFPTKIGLYSVDSLQK